MNFSSSLFQKELMELLFVDPLWEVCITKVRSIITISLLRFAHRTHNSVISDAFCKTMVKKK